jgi:uncharacterized protein YycO
MKKTFSLFLIILFLLPLQACGKEPDLSLLKEGDIIFHESRSAQSKAIMLATKSRYTHTGIIFKKNNSLYVLEAVQPVQVVPIRAFIRSGVNGHFVVKRLKNRKELLTEKNIGKMKKYGKKFIGRKYDIYFGWSNERIYCSELVWKIYKKTVGVEIGKLEKLEDFDLSHRYVKQFLKRRYGKRIPYKEKVISVSTMFHAPNLVTVMEHN